MIDTLEEERKRLRALFMEDGATCACCRQTVKAYRRNIRASMVHNLIKLYALGGEHTWVHVNDLNASTTGQADFSKFKYWDFITPMPGTRGDGSTRTGYWALTENGVRFLDGAATYEACWVYNDVVVKWEEQPFTIHDAVSGFNFQEIL